MSNSSQTQAESSSVRPNASPPIDLEDTERTSSPSSLEHKSTTTSPTSPPIRDVKGKGKAVEVTEVNEDEDEEGLVTPSALTVVDIEPEEASNSRDVPFVSDETEKFAENQPAVSEIEWKEESSENNAYVEGYNGESIDLHYW